MRASRYTGDAVDFSTIVAADEYLHPVPPDAPFTAIETNLYSFNIVAAGISGQIYVLFHPVLRTMSFHVFVYRGTLRHQLQADYFNEHLYLPAVADLAEDSVALGSCRADLTVITPLEAIRIDVEDPARDFALHWTTRAAMPPVGRPGGRHFTQLMRNTGELRLEGQTYVIDGHAIRDRSWNYPRPEEAEVGPPYRWMTGWFDDGCGFVFAMFDTGAFDDPAFGPRWREHHSGAPVPSVNKWESGGRTPSGDLRSGWWSVDGKPRPIVRIDMKTGYATDSLRVERLELDIEDAHGEMHRLSCQCLSMIPKMYWQNLLVYMHFMRLECAGRVGYGELMDTYTGEHLRRYGL